MVELHIQQMQDVILQLLEERGKYKTICPSEAARFIAQLDGHPERWRDWLGQARAAAILMSKQGSVAIFQRGKQIDPNIVKGAIRLRLL